MVGGEARTVIGGQALLEARHRRSPGASHSRRRGTVIRGKAWSEARHDRWGQGIFVVGKARSLGARHGRRHGRSSGARHSTVTAGGKASARLQGLRHLLTIGLTFPQQL